MKKKILVLLAIIASLGLVSCNLDGASTTTSSIKHYRGTVDNYGPEIQLPDVTFESSTTSTIPTTTSSSSIPTTTSVPTTTSNPTTTSSIIPTTSSTVPSTSSSIPTSTTNIYDEIPDVVTDKETIAIDEGDDIEVDAGSASVNTTEKGKYLTAKTNIGYDFLGWYLGDTLLSTETYYIADKDAEKIAAKFELKEEFKNLEFTSTETECVLTGVKENVPNDLVLPEGITKIQKDAFKNSKVVFLTLPESLNEIETCAFGYSKIYSIRFKAMPSIIDTSIDEGSPLCELFLPSQDLEIDDIIGYLSKPYYNYYISDKDESIYKVLGDFVFVIDEGDWTAIGYISDNPNVVFPEADFPEIEYVDNTKYYMSSYLFQNNNNIESVEFSESVKSIGYYSFCNCDNLKEVKIPDGIEYIDEYAFYDCDVLEEVIIPKSVTYIDYYAFNSCDNLKVVSIGDNGAEGEDDIGLSEKVFENCENLVTISLGYNVTYLGDETFQYCNNLSTITLGKRLETIDYDAFYGCYNVKTIYNYSSLEITTGDDSNGRVAQYATTVYNLQDEEQVSTIGNKDDYKYMEQDGYIYLYGYTGNDTNIVIPTFDDKNIIIGDSLFKNNESILSVELNDYVTSIENNAFYNCSNLTTINLNNVDYIGTSAFENCYKLMNITMPKVEAISENAFKNCYSIIQIELPQTLTNLGDDAFDGCYRLVEVINKTEINNIEIGEATNGSIALYAFDVITDVNNSKLVEDNGLLFYIDSDDNVKILIAVLDSDIESLTIESDVTDIIRCAFYGLDKLEEYATNILTQPLSYYFNPVSSSSLMPTPYPGGGGDPILNSYPILSSTTNTVVNAVPDSLKKVVLLDGVTTIPASAFLNCIGIEELYINKNITTYSNGAFNNTNIKKFYYGGTVDDWCNITFVSEKSNPLNNSNIDIYFMIDDEYQILTKIEISVNVTFDDSRFAYFNMEEVEIAEEVTSIPDYAFYNCKNLKKVILPSTIEYIGDSAFADCQNLTIINIPEDVAYIGYRAFENSNIESITIPDKITTLGNYAFAGTKIKSVTIPGYLETIPTGLFSNCNNLQYVKIEDGIETISEAAFANCRSLYTLVLPTSINSIYSYAFDGCENLETVNLSETQVTILTDYSFAYCKNLINFEFPANLVSISSTTFEGCDNFVANTYDNGCYVGTTNNPYRWLIKSRAKTIVNCTVHPDCEKIFDNAFSECAYLRKLIIPAGCTDFGTILKGLTRIEYIEFPYIGTNSFGNTLFDEDNAYLPSMVKTVVINGGESIPASAFYGTTTIKTIKVSGNETTTISENAFKNVTSITNVDLENSNVQTIGVSAFQGCTNADFELGDSIITIGKNAFNSSGITSYIAGLHTTGIGESAFQSCEKLLSADLTNFGKDSLETLGDSIFSSCINLKDVELPNNSHVDHVGSSMFYLCISLESITFPNNITKIWDSAFKNTGIKSVNWNKVANIYDGAFRFSKLESVTIPSGMKLESGDMGNSTTNKYGIFDGCENLTSVVYNSDYIYACTFKDCINLETVTLGSNVTSIAKYMFYNCEKLSSINLDNVTFINMYAFENTAITSYVTTKNVKLESYAFHNCKKLTTVDISNSTEAFKITYGSGANDYNYSYSIFAGCSKLTSVTLSSSIKYIPTGAFEDCESLSQFDFTNITSIGASAFSNTGFTSLVIPSTVLSVQAEAFADCLKLETLEFNGKFVNTTSYYGNNYEKQFKGCTALKTVTMNGITDNITGNAFYGCTALETITLPSTLTVINYNAFTNTAITEITIPEGVEIGSGVFTQCSKLTRVVFNGVAASTSIFSGCSNLEEVILGDNITSIAYGMFSGCSKLTTITLPSTITSIGSYAFSSSGISNIELPEGLTSIGSTAFSGCSKLSSIKIPSTVTSIGSEAFIYCYLLAEVYDLTSTLNVTIGSTDNGYVAYYAKVVHNTDEPSSIVTTDDGYVFAYSSAMSYLIGYNGNNLDLVLPTSFEYNSNTISEYEIGAYSFYKNKNIRSIVMPNSVKAVGDYAFYGCDGLRSVDLGNSLTSIGDYAFSASISTDWQDKEFASSWNYVTSITLPQTLTSIGEKAFYFCYNLFEVINLSELSITKEYSSNGYVARYAKIVHNDANNSVIKVGDDGFVYAYYNDGTAMTGAIVCYLEDTNNLVIPGSFDWNGENITDLYINERAFAYKAYDSVIMQEGINKVGRNAFMVSNIDYLELPNSIKNFHYRPFENCHIKKIKGNTWVISWAISETNNYNATYLEEAIIIDPSANSTINSIYTNQFNNCTSLKSVVIPKSIKTINSSAFYKTEALECLYYCGTEEEYNNINLNETGNYGYYYGTKYYYSEEAPTTEGNYWHYVDGNPVVWNLQ